MNHLLDPDAQAVCRNIDTLAMTYLDGELEGEDLRELELHLLTCGACRTRVDERAVVLGTVRRALVAPPAPDLLRARVLRALDEEDRAQRRGLSGWLLPGGAMVAAVAALVVFVSFRGSPPERAVERDVIREQQAVRPPEVEGPITVAWAQEHYDQRVVVPTFGDARVQLRGARLDDLRDRPALQLFYRATTPAGLSLDLRALVFDARGLPLGGQRVRVGDLALRVGVYEGISVVSYVDPAGRAYVFTTLQLRPGDLATLVGNSDLLQQVHRDQFGRGP